ncbi:TlpA family protein disulfide reductase [Bergeyella zoohelcum]|uniref:Transporter n=1 Tax=Bergeyella zoohelcum TaxID=1015 RepID=A0A7Z8YLY5_9FLAO|nr:TlpA disulfide reductase family protein [Bergeyella zoohelcum]VDH02824.1 transporter [Bergeyella zoohelcum]
MKKGQNIIFIVLTVVIVGMLFIPGVKSFIQEMIFPIKKIENATTLSDKAYQVELKGINTSNANLSDFKGKKPLFLNFWGTWCAPCREEWPSIQKLYDEKKGEMDFVLIAMMDKEEAVRKYLEENQFTVPVYLAESPLDESILPKSFPTTFVLSKEGRIVLKETATRDWYSESALNILNQMGN